VADRDPIALEQLLRLGDQSSSFIRSHTHAGDMPMRAAIDSALCFVGLLSISAR
jgi:hypothetical protein